MSLVAEQQHLVVTDILDLENVINTKGQVLTMIFATWCPFCQRFLPVFTKYAQGREDFLAVQDDDEIVATEYGVDIIPSLLYFENGVVKNRLEGRPGIGLGEKQLVTFINSCGLT